MNFLPYTVEDEIVRNFCDEGDNSFAHPMELPYMAFDNPFLRFLLDNPFDNFDGEKIDHDLNIHHEEMYINALYYSKILFIDLFKKTKKLTLVLKFWEPELLPPNKLPKSFKQLKNLGLKLNNLESYQFKIRDLSKEKIEHGYKFGFEYSYALEFDRSFQNVGPIIRSICGKDLGISYSPHIVANFIDLENCLIMNIYDARGLTITARDKNKISELYTKYSHLLNPHHLESMQEIFES